MQKLTTGQYYGELKKEINLEGLKLSEYDYLADRTDWHYHENPYFMFLLKGKVMDINSHRSFPCVAGSLLFQNWQDPHFNAKYSDSARGFHLEIDKAWLSSHDFNLQFPKGNTEINDPKIVELFVKAQIEIQQQDLITAEAMQDLIWQIVSRLGNLKHRIEKNKAKWIDLVGQMVEELDTEELTLGNVAREIGLHPVYFCREFPRHFQSTFGEYVRMTKLKRALPLMTTGTNSLAQIANQCGFSDQSHFTRCFRKRYGVTPARYRALLRRM